MSDDEKQEILSRLQAVWPEPLTIAPETKALLKLRDDGLIVQYDSWPDGRRRWQITHAGTAAIRRGTPHA